MFLKTFIFELENESKIFHPKTSHTMKSMLFKSNFWPLALLLLALFSTTSCIDNLAKAKESEGGFTSEKNAKKEIKEIILVDNGAVVPVPTIRRFVMTLKNLDNFLLSYSENTGTYINENQSNMMIGDDNREAVRDEIEKIAELAEDGLDVNAGKLPCVGMKSLNVEVVYNTGDTSRFEVSGAARCDPSLYPSVWALDSIGMVVFKSYKSRF